MSKWQTKVERSKHVIKTSNDFGKNGERFDTKVVWKDSKESGMPKSKRSAYPGGRYSPAGNTMEEFDKDLFSSTSQFGEMPFPRTPQSVEHVRKSHVVGRTGGITQDPHTKTVVKETRTQTPQGVRMVKSTVTCTTSGNKPAMSQESEKTKWEVPTQKFWSLGVSDGGKPKTTSKVSMQKPIAVQKTFPPPSSRSFKDQALQLHNKYRRLHGVPDVTWNDQLARGAQVWADKIARMNALKHDQSNKDGENIAFFGGRRDNIAKESVDMWYNEVKKYQFNRSGCKSGTGHFTQVVWKATKEIGMSMSQSSDGLSTYVVARYRPAGNMIGDYEANVFPPKR